MTYLFKILRYDLTSSDWLEPFLPTMLVFLLFRHAYTMLEVEVCLFLVGVQQVIKFIRLKEEEMRFTKVK